MSQRLLQTGLTRQVLNVKISNNLSLSHIHIAMAFLEHAQKALVQRKLNDLLKKLRQRDRFHTMFKCLRLLKKRLRSTMGRSIMKQMSQ